MNSYDETINDKYFEDLDKNKRKLDNLEYNIYKVKAENQEYEKKLILKIEDKNGIVEKIKTCKIKNSKIKHENKSIE